MGDINTISKEGLVPASQDIIYAPPNNYFGEFHNIRIIAGVAARVYLWKQLEGEDPVLLMCADYDEGDWSDDDTIYELRQKESLLAETDGHPNVTFVLNGKEREALT